MPDHGLDAFQRRTRRHTSCIIHDPQRFGSINWKKSSIARMITQLWVEMDLLPFDVSLRFIHHIYQMTDIDAESRDLKGNGSFVLLLKRHWNNSLTCQSKENYTY